jgi:hypothetical protein
MAGQQRKGLHKVRAKVLDGKRQEWLEINDILVINGFALPSSGKDIIYCRIRTQ